MGLPLIPDRVIGLATPVTFGSIARFFQFVFDFFATFSQFFKFSSTRSTYNLFFEMSGSSRSVRRQSLRSLRRLEATKTPKKTKLKNKKKGQTLTGRLPPEDGFDWPENLGKRVSDNFQHLICARWERTWGRFV